MGGPATRVVSSCGSGSVAVTISFDSAVGSDSKAAVMSESVAVTVRFDSGSGSDSKAAVIAACNHGPHYLLLVMTRPCDHVWPIETILHATTGDAIRGARHTREQCLHPT